MCEQDKAVIRALEGIALAAQQAILGDDDRSDPNLDELRRSLNRLNRARAKTPKAVIRRALSASSWDEAQAVLGEVKS